VGQEKGQRDTQAAEKTDRRPAAEAEAAAAKPKAEAT